MEDDIERKEANEPLTCDKIRQILQYVTDDFKKFCSISDLSIWFGSVIGAINHHSTVRFFWREL